MPTERAIDLRLKPKEAHKACVDALNRTYAMVAWTIDSQSYYDISGHGRWRLNDSIFEFNLGFKILKGGVVTVRLAADTMFAGPLESLASSIVDYEQKFIDVYQTKSAEAQQAIDRSAFDGRVFMSYASEDFKFADKLRRDLYLNEFEVWVDQDYLRPGDRWPKKIESAIADSNVFVLVISNEALSSPWVKREYRHATKNRKSIFPVLHDPTTIPAGWEKEFGSIQYAHLTKGKYPRGVDELAAVIREACGKTSS